MAWEYSNYNNIEELDQEDLEDVEVALYGMLHYSNDEGYASIPTSSDSSSTPTQIDEEKNQETPTSSASNNINNKVTPTESITRLPDVKSKTKGDSESFNGQVPSTSKQTLSTKKKGSKSNNLLPDLCNRNIVVEKSMERKSKKKSYEVITLSDEEDSKYASINKATTLRTKRKEQKELPPVCILSDSDDTSVIVLENRPTPKKVFYSDSSSDSSDDEVQVLNSSVASLGTVDFRLNISDQSNMNIALTTSLSSSLSQSYWKKYSSTKWTPEMIEFYDQAGRDVDMQAIQKSLPKNANWSVVDADRFGDGGSRGQRNRYFGNASKTRCANCSQWDHDARHCKEPKKIKSCKVCGMPGHRTFDCPRKLCLGCGRKSNILVECCPECRRENKVTCLICRSKHITQRCPDLWRRYHATIPEQGETLNDTGSSLKPDRELFCCNCTRRGHIVHDCPERIWSKYAPVTSRVFSYENPKKFLNAITNDGTSSVTLSENGKEVWVVGSCQSGSPKKARFHRYCFPLTQKITDNIMRAYTKSIIGEFKDVSIAWRRQHKKGRMVVEFTGNGDTKEAKFRFKKLLTFQGRKAPQQNDTTNSRSPEKRDNASSSISIPAAVISSHLNSGSSSQGFVRGTTVLPQNGTTSKESSPSKSFKPVEDDSNPSVDNNTVQSGIIKSLSEIRLIHTNSRGRQCRQSLEVNLTEKQKKGVGKLLSSMEKKHKVQITSCYVGKAWEITIHKRPESNTSVALSLIVRHLKSFTVRPVGA